MPIPNEYKDVLEMLLQATQKGRVNWLEEGTRFYVKLPEYNFEIWSGTDELGEKQFVAVALKQHPPTRKTMDNWSIDEDDEDFEKLETLYITARRYARSIDSKLGSLRNLLKSNSKIGLNEEE